MVAIIVHGGAWNIPDEQVTAHQEGCLEAIRIGYRALNDGGSAVDAVEAAVRSMEDDPTFDAGRGSFLNRDGEVEMDAVIMNGDDLSIGAVAAVQCIRHPVTLARKVMEDTEHCMLVGRGARSFARSIGMEIVPTTELLTPRELERLEEIRKIKGFRSRSAFEHLPQKKGTVGAVALDSNGQIAAATSTGGTPNKMPGRVGDSSLVGCGTYADSQSAGVSATGWGESIMKVTLARRVCESVEKGADPTEATRIAINYLAQRVSGLGGLICLDNKGRSGYFFNTPRMAVAWVDQNGSEGVHI
jgi:beta-aspartyl-peptidase (threonine type)